MNESQKVEMTNDESGINSTERFETYEKVGEYLYRNGIKIIGGFFVLIASLIYLHYKYEMQLSLLGIIAVSYICLSVFSWWYQYRKNSKMSSIEVNNERIIVHTPTSEKIYNLGSLRDVELPTQKEYSYGNDYIYMYFGNGESLELEGRIPYFPEIKHAIMKRITVHPELDFLRKRLSKEDAT